LDKILEVNNLKTYFYTRDGVVPAVDGVSFHVRRGETVGLVGESGCGKSITAMSILRLVHPGRIVDGSIIFNGEDILQKPLKEMRAIRGNSISMIFQEPMTSLNPVYTIGNQIVEVIKLHQGLSVREACNKAIKMLEIVGIPAPEKRINEYPHHLSGGMRQRAMIAMTLSCNPKLIIADEPTTALDVTIQAQILDKLNDLKRLNNSSILMITHDLGVIAEMSDRVIVMYAGAIVEMADVFSLFREPLHPYTQGLLTSIPSLDTPKGRLSIIKGYVPRPTDFPTGCRFHPRCPRWSSHPGLCDRYAPPVRNIGEREVACWEYWSEEEISSYIRESEIAQA
jgi:oligopeptide/dipeptide ABC transporter ATP-binding protein